MATNIKAEVTTGGELSEEAKAFGAFLRKLRKAKGLNQLELAKLIDITGAYYGHFETGRRLPSLKIINRLADVFDSDYFELATLAGYDEGEAMKKEMPRKSELGKGLKDESDDDQHSDVTDAGNETTSAAGTQETSVASDTPASNLNSLPSDSPLSNERLDWAIMCIAQDPTYRLAEQFIQDALSNSIKALVIQLYQAETTRQILTADESAALNQMLRG